MKAWYERSAFLFLEANLSVIDDENCGIVSGRRAERGGEYLSKSRVRARMSK